MENENIVIKAVLAYVTKYDNNQPDPMKSLKAYYKKDKHLNNIPLNFWDSLAIAFSLTKKMSMAQGVVTLKDIVRERLEAQND